MTDVTSSPSSQRRNALALSLPLSGTKPTTLAECRYSLTPHEPSCYEVRGVNGYVLRDTRHLPDEAIIHPSGEWFSAKVDDRFFACDGVDGRAVATFAVAPFGITWEQY